jgi:hypothetical protein
LGEPEWVALFDAVTQADVGRHRRRATALLPCGARARASSSRLQTLFRLMKLLKLRLEVRRHERESTAVSVGRRPRIWGPPREETAAFAAEGNAAALS